jgi:hypothetical protein
MSARRLLGWFHLFVRRHPLPGECEYVHTLDPDSPDTYRCTRRAGHLGVHYTRRLNKRDLATM